MVARGNGDGTFGRPSQFGGVPGANQIVVGDFTHDRITDIATENESVTGSPGNLCGFHAQNANSFSIYAGHGDGTFSAPTSFALGAQTDDYLFSGSGADAPLNTNDLDRDGFPDLILGYGRVFLTRAPQPNRPPVVSAGSDRVMSIDQFDLHATATDPDGHSCFSTGATTAAAATSVSTATLVRATRRRHTAHIPSPFR